MRSETELKTAERASRENTFGIEFIQRAVDKNGEPLTDWTVYAKTTVAVSHENEKGDK